MKQFLTKLEENKTQFYNDAQRQGLLWKKWMKKKIIPKMSGTKKSACICH